MTRSAITIRTARPSDADAVTALARQLGYDAEPRAVAARLSRLLARSDQQFLVAEDEGRAVAWVHMLLAEYVEAEAFVVIGGLVVDRAYRRHGIGRQLLACAEEWAAARDCSVVRLSSSMARTEAHAFYERVGFVNLKTQYSFAKSIRAGGVEALRAFVPDVT